MITATMRAMMAIVRVFIEAASGGRWAAAGMSLLLVLNRAYPRSVD